MAVRRLASGRLAVEFEQGGVRIFRRLPPGASREDGKAYESKLRRDLFMADKLGLAPEVSIAAAIQLWLENVAVHQKDAHRAKLRSKAWAKWIEGKTLRQAPEVAKEAVSRWSAVARGEPSASSGDATTRLVVAAQESASTRTTGALAAGTINRRLALLKAVCKWAYQQGMIGENLSGRIRMLREGPGREVYLTLAQVRSLAKNAPTSACRAAILILSYSGLRVSELIALTTSTTRSTIFVANSKSGKPRIVPVPMQARSSLAYWLALSPRPSYWQFHSDFDKARRKAKMPHVRPHDLRHTAASWLINSGVDLYTVGRLLGHSTPLTTQRYAHLSQASLRRAMARLK